MKKFLILLAAIAALSSRASAATTIQYHQVGSVAISSATFSGGFVPWSRTVAQLVTLTPTTTGQVVFCSDCAANAAKGTLCVSSGSTAAYQWTLSTGTVCK